MNLLIDTHLNDITLITFKNNEIVKIKKLENEKNSSKNIMPLIKTILEKEKLESIIVINGPGSFTGVRLGVTIAKTLAYTLNISIKTISTLECLALSLPDNDKKIVGFSDNNGYYVGFFDNNETIQEFIYIKNKEFKEFVNNHKVYLDVEIDYDKVIKFCEFKDFVNPHKVNPIYIKKLDIEEND